MTDFFRDKSTTSFILQSQSPLLTTVYLFVRHKYFSYLFCMHKVEKIDSGWQVQAGSTRKYILLKKVNPARSTLNLDPEGKPDPSQPVFLSWGSGSTQKIGLGLFALIQGACFLKYLSKSNIFYVELGRRNISYNNYHKSQQKIGTFWK